MERPMEISEPRSGAWLVGRTVGPSTGRGTLPLLWLVFFLSASPSPWNLLSSSNGLINLFVQFLPSSGARILETRSIRSLNNHLVTNNWWWLDLYILQSGKAFLYLFYCRKFQLPPQLALHNAFSSLNDWIYNFIGWTTLITTSSSWK